MRAQKTAWLGLLWQGDMLPETHRAGGVTLLRILENCKAEGIRLCTAFVKLFIGPQAMV